MLRHPWLAANETRMRDPRVLEETVSPADSIFRYDSSRRGPHHRRIHRILPSALFFVSVSFSNMLSSRLSTSCVPLPVDLAHTLLLGSQEQRGVTRTAWASGGRLRRLLERLAIRRTGDRYEMRPSFARLAPAAGVILTASLLLYLFTVFLLALVRFEYFSPIGNVEEAANTYIAARNYEQYGPRRTLLLQDLSHSSDPADHPYIYNHMPPGPELFTFVLLKMTGGSYRLTRLIFALVSVAGLIVYLRFLGLILRQRGLQGASYALWFIGPWFLLNNFDRQPYSPFALLAFAPLFSLQKYYKTGRQVYLSLTLFLGLLSSVYLEYVLLSGVIWCWVLLWLTQAVHIERRHAAAFVGLLFAGISLHLLQNLLFMGPAVFWHELASTLGNRMVGVPSAEEIKAWYATEGIVHHGARSISLLSLVKQLLAQLTFWGRDAVLLIAAVAVGRTLLPNTVVDFRAGTLSIFRGEGTRSVAWLIRLWTWILGTVLLPNVMFPAFNQDVTFGGTRANAYFLAIGVVALVSHSMRTVGEPLPSLGIKNVAPRVTVATPETRENIDWWLVLNTGVLAAVLWLALATFVTVAMAAGRPAARLSGTLAALVMLGVSMVAVLAKWALAVGRRIRRRAGRPTATWPSKELMAARIWEALGNKAWVRIALDLGCRVVLVFAILALALQVAKGNEGQIRQIRQWVAEMRLSDLVDLREFAGEPFMTNIYSTPVGFFVKEAGHGVCGPDSIAGPNGLDPQRCKTAFMRRVAVWRTKTPRYFFFVTADVLFPGFSDCVPSSTAILTRRGGDECVEWMDRRLTEQFAEIFRNRLFAVFDLTRPPPSDLIPSVNPLLKPPREVRAVRLSPTVILLSWAPEPFSEAFDYRVAHKRRVAGPFSVLEIVPNGTTSLLVRDLEQGTRHFFRIQSCTSQGCSRYTYVEARTGR